MNQFEETSDDWIDELYVDDDFDEIEAVFDAIDELGIEAGEAFFDEDFERDIEYGVGLPTMQSTTGIASSIAHRRSLPAGTFETVVFPVGFEAQQGIQQWRGRRGQVSIVDVSMPTEDGRGRVNIEVDERESRMVEHMHRHVEAMTEAYRNWREEIYDRRFERLGARRIARSPLKTTHSAFVLLLERDPNRVREIRRVRYIRTESGMIQPVQEVITFTRRQQPPTVNEVNNSRVLIQRLGTPVSLPGATVLLRQPLPPRQGQQARTMQLGPSLRTRRQSMRAARPNPQRSRQQASPATFSMSRRNRPPRRFDTFEDFLYALESY